MTKWNEFQIARISRFFVPESLAPVKRRIRRKSYSIWLTWQRRSQNQTLWVDCFLSSLCIVKKLNTRNDRGRFKRTETGWAEYRTTRREKCQDQRISLTANSWRVELLEPQGARNLRTCFNNYVLILFPHTFEHVSLILLTRPPTFCEIF